MKLKTIILEFESTADREYVEIPINAGSSKEVKQKVIASRTKFEESLK